MDVPNERKVHVMPMPRSGGISMAIGAFVPIMLWVPVNDFVRAVYIGSFIIVICGIIDDIKNLTYKQKLSAQIAGAIIVILYGGVRIQSLGNILPSGLSLPFYPAVAITLLFIVGVTNAINLSDGLDGLAGGISVLSFVAIGFFAYRCGNIRIATMSVAVAGAILGFLRFNTHPAIVFMGDAGSQMLGFLSVVFALKLVIADTPYNKLAPLFLIGFPILDTLTVMVERISKGEAPFKADKNHFHHKLMKLGLYHSESVLSIYILQAIFICFAFELRFYSEWLNLFVFLTLAGCILLFFEVCRRKHFMLRNDTANILKSKSILSLIAGDKLSIRIVFNLMKWGLLILFIFQCILSARMPVYISWAAVFFVILILMAKFYHFDSKTKIIRLSLYSSIPFILYFSTVNVCSWMTDSMITINNIAFIILVILVIITLNLTRRQKGFKFNPLDFLVFLVIIVFPNFPSIFRENVQIKIVAAKVLILLFSYDVLIGELRRDDSFLDNSVLTVLTVIALKGFVCR